MLIYQLGKHAISQSAVEKFVPAGKETTVSYTFPTEKNDFTRGEIQFFGVHAFRWTRDYSCTLEMRGAYDKLLEIESSPWAKELADERAQFGYPVTLHHYMVFFDSGGCYEVVAESVTVKEE